MRRFTLLLLSVVWLAAAVCAEPEPIKVYRVGSSSFGYDLIRYTRAIVEAEGKYDFVIIQTIGWLNFTPEQHRKLCNLANDLSSQGLLAELRDRLAGSL